jgi:2-dehydro-3-deoxyphosphogluconate aldolase/(4S)-4-hydroxy-2-oxoglutarate aldolase
MSASAMTVVEEAILRTRLIAIIRVDDHGSVLEIARTLADAGVEVLEVTIEHPDGLHSVERVGTAMSDRIVLGAGTIIDPADVLRAHDCGASFCVSPHFDREVVESAHELDMLAIPGALTATEVVGALRSGVRLVKLFPAGSIGVDYLKALRAPLPQAHFVPTGGITATNAAEWLRAGAVAVAMGSEIVARSGRLEGLAERARRAVSATSGEA